MFGTQPALQKWQLFLILQKPRCKGQADGGVEGSDVKGWLGFEATELKSGHTSPDGGTGTSNSRGRADTSFETMRLCFHAQFLTFQAKGLSEQEKRGSVK